MKKNLNNSAYVLHIHDAVRQITGYASTHSFKDFNNSEWDQSAVLRYLEIIGEAASKIDLTFRKEHPEISWREISDLRNVIIHEYMNVDLNLIWQIITKDIPTLKLQIDTLLDAINKK